MSGFVSKIGVTEMSSSSLVALGALVAIIVMAYIYPKGYKGVTPTVEGVKFGALMACT